MTCTILSLIEVPLGINEHEPPYTNMKAEIILLVSGLYAQGYSRFYVNYEYGVSLWTAELLAALKRSVGMELYIMTPYEEQAKDWPEEYRERWFRVHERADSVTMVCTQHEPDCYARADRRMIEASDLLVICGKEDAAPEAVQYAQAQGVEVFCTSLYE